MRRCFIWLITCIFALTAVNAAQYTAPSASDLPDMSGPFNAMLSKADEYQIGLMAMQQLRDQGQVLEDPEVTTYLQSLGSRLAAQTRDDDQNFQYYPLRDPVINAFATYGGFVLIYTGLILAMDNEAQLAAVMAHETGHVRQRHLARALQAQTRMSLASTAAMLAALILGAASGAGGQAMEGTVAMAQGIMMQQSINFTRSEEAEADAVGMGLLAGAGFDPYAMADAFEALQRGEGLEESVIPALLLDHPVTTERVAEARSRASQYPRAHSENSMIYELVRERVRVLVAPPETNMIQYYANLQTQRALSPAERYGQALAQMRGGQAHAAVLTLRELQNTYPHETMLYSALGQALNTDGQQEASLALFERSMKLFPRNVAITVRYAETLMQVGKAKLAHTLLLDLFNNVDATPDQIRLTALAASAAGDTGDAYYYMSLYQLAGGNLALAGQQLELALAAPDLTTVQRQRFRAQLEQVRGWLREQQQARRGGV
jgi:predicted Zn-dependent protease